jgi:hypothetical protein
VLNLAFFFPAFSQRPTQSSISILAVTHGVDLQDVTRLLGEADPVVPDPKSQFAGSSLQSLDVAFSAFREAIQRSENAHGGLPIQAANISPRAFGPGDFLHA